MLFSAQKKEADVSLWLYEIDLTCPNTINRSRDLACKDFKDNFDELMLGNTKITVMHTPGHSMGSVCYLFMEDKIMFSGDTLFRLTAGRVDFYGGDGREELRSLAKIGKLEGDYKVYPGHEADTTLDFERKNNQYMRTRFRKEK